MPPSFAFVAASSGGLENCHYDIAQPRSDSFDVPIPVGTSVGDLVVHCYRFQGIRNSDTPDLTDVGVYYKIWDGTYDSITFNPGQGDVEWAHMMSFTPLDFAGFTIHLIKTRQSTISEDLLTATFPGETDAAVALRVQHWTAGTALSEEAQGGSITGADGSIGWDDFVCTFGARDQFHISTSDAMSYVLGDTEGDVVATSSYGLTYATSPEGEPGNDGIREFCFGFVETVVPTLYGWGVLAG